MVIFLNDDRAYLAWIGHHRDGFVLDSQRTASKKPLVVHRASCPETTARATRRTHLTTWRRIKACSLSLDELLQWCEEEAGDEPQFCEQCRPGRQPQAAASTAEVNSNDNRNRPLTRLAREILDFVLESAVIDLDSNVASTTTVGDTAAAVEKTTGQIVPALLRLLQEDLIEVDRGIQSDSAPSGDQRIFPTQRALRSLPSFEEMTDDQLAQELAQLRRAEQ